MSDVSTVSDTAAPRSLSWMREHGLHLAVLVVSLLTAACYLVGRASLSGWYDAAGVPALMFSWSAQDIVIRGIGDVETWLLVMASVVCLAVYGVIVDLGSSWLDRFVKERSRLRMRGEGCDQRSLRKRWAREARRARRGATADASAATERWRVLGKRGALRRPSRRNGSKWQPARSVLYALLAFALVAGCFAVYLLIVVLHEYPYDAGAKAFRMQYAAATGHWPPQRALPAWRAEKPVATQPTKRPSLSLQEAIARGREQLQRYAFVRIEGSKEAGTAGPVCGWLVQGAGGQVVLLNEHGLRALNFGDAPFGWISTTPGDCLGEAPPGVRRN